MENFNKIISFVLGLVVVIVFLIIITGRWNVRNLFRVSRGNSQTALITPTTKPEAKNTEVTVTRQPTLSVTKAPPRTPTPTRRPMQAVNSIPNTGADLLIAPLLLGGLIAGVSLRRRK